MSTFSYRWKSCSKIVQKNQQRGKTAEPNNSLKKQHTQGSPVGQPLRTQAAAGLHQTHSALKTGTSGPKLKDMQAKELKRSKEICEGHFKVWLALASGACNPSWHIRCAVSAVPPMAPHRLPPPDKDTETRKGGLPSTPEMTACGLSALPLKGICF